MHILIVGARGVGKSTLISRVLRQLGKPCCGFETKKEDALADASLGSPVYIYEVGKMRLQTQENLLGYCKNQHPITYCDAFDRFAPRLLQEMPSDAIFVMDELGFMEASSEAFCQAVLQRLDGALPVIAAVKDKAVPFLKQVRSHPNVRCFEITESNRDELYEQVLAFAQAHWQTP